MLFASVFKREWAIDDYPVRLRFQPVPEPSQASRLKPIPWTASVINWPAMSGHGNTKQEALAELRRRFEQIKLREKKLPRPGIKVPIEFAVSRRVERYPELAKEFFHQILEVDWANLSFVSSPWKSQRLGKSEGFRLVTQMDGFGVNQELRVGAMVCVSVSLDH